MIRRNRPLSLCTLLSWSLALPAVAMVSLGCDSEVKTVPPEPGCLYDGVRYQVGDWFDAGDDCNSCGCQADGRVACTTMACPEDGCVYDGQDLFPHDCVCTDSQCCELCCCEPGGVVSCEPMNDCDSVCEWDGAHYAAGETFPAGDGCNTCTCYESGSVQCTTAECLSCEHDGSIYAVGDTFPAGDSCNQCQCLDVYIGQGVVICEPDLCTAECIYAGMGYLLGESFDALDGCNTCTCASGGGASCTEMNCPCDPDAEWHRSYVSTDPAECAIIDYACPGNTASFVNSCGCGCEQYSSCPEWFNCLPPAQCDIPALQAQCPFSKFPL